MAKLNQIVAVVNGKKNETQAAVTELHKKCQKPELFNGLVRVYKPLDDEGERFPDENKKIQYSVGEVLGEAKKLFGELINVVATQDSANCEAKADVVVDGKVVLSQVPITHMLFLEKQLVDLHTFVAKLPTLDDTEEWVKDDNKDCYVSKEKKTNKSKKVPRTLVKAPATEHHPAQVDVYYEDVQVGNWHATSLSAAMPVKEKNALLVKVKKLQQAVTYAREEANIHPVKDIKYGDELMKFVFE